MSVLEHCPCIILLVLHLKYISIHMLKKQKVLKQRLNYDCTYQCIIAMHKQTGIQALVHSELFGRH